jgi:3-hydroxyisobutyrate dehydrogenase
VGTLLVDQTTGDPTATRETAAELAKRGVDLIDAPVSGGAMGADAARLLLWWAQRRIGMRRFIPF